MVATQPLRQPSTNGVQFPKPKGKSNAICSRCGYFGHLVDKCFQLIGYPPRWKGPRGKRSLPTQSEATTNSRLPIANNVSSLEQNSSIPNTIFSQEQIQNLFKLANSLSS